MMPKADPVLQKHLIFMFLLGTYVILYVQLYLLFPTFSCKCSLKIVILETDI
jgi:hypothetical protein